MSSRVPRTRLLLILAAGLFLGALLPFLGALDHGFVNYDDYTYVTENHWVQQGLTLASLRWAFTTLHFSNWHPLTWIGYQLDFELFGLDPRGYHLVSLVLHALNAVLLFLVVRRLTRATGRALAMSLLWAIHPLRVESVVWISERKDLVSLLFGLLAIAAYHRFATTTRRGWWMAWTAAAMAASLMTKPMLVTLPLLLLLLDYWPLERLGSTGREWLRCCREKWPLWTLSLISSAVAILAQSGAMPDAQQLPVSTRLANAADAIRNYLWDQVAPANLAVFYPLDPSVLTPARWITGFLLVLGITILAFAIRRSHRFVLVGWGWFLVALLPVLGLIQVGGQARADRYTYLPSIGFWWLVVFGSWTWLNRSLGPSWARRVGIGLVALVALPSAWCTQRQTTTWHDSVTLFQQALAAAGPSYTTHLNLGRGYSERGEHTTAAASYRSAIALDPDRPDAWNNLASALHSTEQLREALAAYERALTTDPDNPEILVNRASLLDDLGRPAAALRDLCRALAAAPDLSRARAGTAALLRRVPSEEALRAVEAGLELAPDQPLLLELHRRLSLSD